MFFKELVTKTPFTFLLDPGPIIFCSCNPCNASENWLMLFWLFKMPTQIFLMLLVLLIFILSRPWRVPATRPDPNFFLLPEPDPNYFSKSPSIGFFSAGCFPADCFKPFTIIFKFCCILVLSTRNPLFLNQNVLDTKDESKESQENLTIDLWCILIYFSRGNQIQDLFTSRQSNQSTKTVANYFLMKPMLFSNLNA